MAFPQRKRTPSFSSSVLDFIYRSIDESNGFHSDVRGSTNSNNVIVSSSSSSSPSSSSSLSSPTPNKKDDKLSTLRRAIMDEEHWLNGRSSTTTTISSDSSAFSSEVESYRAKRRSRKLVDHGDKSGDQRRRINRTLVVENDRLFSKSDDDKKVKVVKILEELKKSKQPVSPGARLTSFLNSIFQSNAKKVKLCSVGTTTDIKSSSSRSCFSRPSYKTDNNNNNCNNLRRPVRFYPVKVTIDGDCRDSVHKNITRGKKPTQELYTKKTVDRVTSLKDEIKTKNRQTKLTCITRNRAFKDSLRCYIDEREEEDEDVWSYSSSDLFELDSNLIGMGRYTKELPVYETTDFKTNQAIARGLLL